MEDDGSHAMFGGTRERARAAGLPSPKPVSILRKGELPVEGPSSSSCASSEVGECEAAGRPGKRVSIVSPTPLASSQIGDGAAQALAPVPAGSEAPQIALRPASRNTAVAPGPLVGKRSPADPGGGSENGSGGGAKRVRSSSNG